MKDNLEELRQDEGLELMPYRDTRGFLTIGIGTKLPLTEEEAYMLAEHRLKQKTNEVKIMLSHLEIDNKAWDILINMAYNLGTEGLLKFKKMIRALEKQDYKTASLEMIDSKWYNQVGVRAEKLVKKMESI